MWLSTCWEPFVRAAAGGSWWLGSHRLIRTSAPKHQIENTVKQNKTFHSVGPVVFPAVGGKIAYFQSVRAKTNVEKAGAHDEAESTERKNLNALHWEAPLFLTLVEYRQDCIPH